MLSFFQKLLKYFLSVIFDQYYTQPWKHHFLCLTKIQIIFCLLWIKLRCSHKNKTKGGEGGRQPDLVPSAQILWLPAFTPRMGHCWLWIQYCLPSTGSLEMLEQQVCRACLGGPYPPPSTVCFTHWHHALEVQSQVHFQGPALDPVVTTVTKLLRG